MADPIVKWAGGKRQLLETLTPMIPDSFGTYYEPFLGGGALFFHLKPSRAVLNDSNHELINLYRQLQDNCEVVIADLIRLQEDYNTLEDPQMQTDYYLSRRTEFNAFIAEGANNARSAALFIFLNKSSFNGLYRVGKNGLFNVPSAHRKKLNLFDQANLRELISLLKGCRILCGDYEDACRDAQKGDFVYFDPPYLGTYSDYQSGGFSIHDHIRLAELFKRLSERGVYCLLSNSDNDDVIDLYSGFKQQRVQVKRLINRVGSDRTGWELIISNL